MATLNQTTLAAACGASDLTLNLTSATGFVDGQYIRVDNEWMIQKGAPISTFVAVVRGKEGSAVQAHGIAANVTTGVGTDFPANPIGTPMTTPFQVPTEVFTFGVAGNIPLPLFIEEQICYLHTGTAGAFNIGAPTAPTAAIEGAMMTFIAQDAEAYVLTTTANGYNGSTHIATFNGTAGSSFTIVAKGTQWDVLTLTGVTLS